MLKQPVILGFLVSITLIAFMHPRDEQVYPIGTVVRIIKTGQFSIIKDQTFVKDNRNFLNYLGQIEGREGLYALYHEDVDLECLPVPTDNI
ncbi:hypothetical protein BH10BAC4_BH10BAC4_25190 [soil metagenome]